MICSLLPFVKPLPAGYRLPTDDYVPPSRKDLILDGRLEGPPPEKPDDPVPPSTGGFDQGKK